MLFDSDRKVAGLGIPSLSVGCLLQIRIDNAPGVRTSASDPLFRALAVHGAGSRTSYRHFQDTFSSPEAFLALARVYDDCYHSAPVENRW